jgi:hypothetical protein
MQHCQQPVFPTHTSVAGGADTFIVHILCMTFVVLSLVKRTAVKL